MVCAPLGYLEFVGLMSEAAAVLTDSGGVQEETTALGVPCVTLRTTTERPITVTLGTNELVDPSDAGAIVAGGSGKASDKIKAMEEAGITVCSSPAEIGEKVQSRL